MATVRNRSSLSRRDCWTGRFGDVEQHADGPRHHAVGAENWIAMGQDVPVCAVRHCPRALRRERPGRCGGWSSSDAYRALAAHRSADKSARRHNIDRRPAPDRVPRAQSRPNCSRDPPLKIASVDCRGQTLDELAMADRLTGLVTNDPRASNDCRSIGERMARFHGRSIPVRAREPEDGIACDSVTARQKCVVHYNRFARHPERQNNGSVRPT